MIDRRRAVAYKNPHNTSDALLIGGAIAAAIAFFWWLSRRVATTPLPSTRVGLDYLGVE
jgi:hypothetical protein